MDVVFWVVLVGLLIFWPTIWLILSSKRGGKVHLTFDDGPDPETTPLVLDVLKRYRVKATFFVIGQKAEKYPELIKRITEEGHGIGNHSYSHKNYLGIYPPWQVLYEYKKCSEVISELTGKKLSLARLPQGLTTIYSYLALRLNGYNLVNWTVSAKDWEEKTTAKDITQKVLMSTKPGSVILLHDSLDFKKGSQAKIYEALPEIIEGLKNKGVNFNSL